MKIRKLICISMISFLLLGVIVGCTNKASQGDNTKQSKNNYTQDSGKMSSQNDSLKKSSSENKTNSLSITSNTSGQTQENVINKIYSLLNTRVPIMLPTYVPLDKGNYLTAATISKAGYYKVDFYQSGKPIAVNSKTASKGELISTVEGTLYNDADSAKKSINGYIQVEPSKYPDMEIDLGYNIKALQEGAAGHGYLIWNEGRWSLQLDSPNDTAYINKKYPDSKELAQNVVQYLNKYMLPAPKSIGIIKINNWNNSSGTTIQWQHNKEVYRVWSQDPMTALKMAVAMKFK